MPEAEPPDSYPDDRPRAATVRSRIMLEIASELVGDPGWDHKQARIQFRRQGTPDWAIGLFGSDSPRTFSEVAAGQIDFAIVNPATMAAVALGGHPPFEGPIELRAIATIPSYDQLGIAVHPDSGVETLADIVDRAAGLRISLRGDRPDHAIHVMTDHVLAALGTSVDDLRRRGAVITEDPGIPHQEPRRSALERHAANVVIDEGIYNWVDVATGAGFRFLDIAGPAAARLTALGYRTSMLAPSRFPSLEREVNTLDFSGFLVYTHQRVPDTVVTAFCEAMVARADRIPWQGGPSLPLDRMVADTIDAPLPIPLHSAAAIFWSTGLGR